MILSIHCQSEFTDYEYFKNIMDNFMKEYSDITHCYTGRSISTLLAQQYFENSTVICEIPKLSHIKIQNLFKIMEQSDISLFFFREDVNTGMQLTRKTISRAKNLNKQFQIVNYPLADNE